MAGPKPRFVAALYLISFWILLVSPANYQFQLQKIENIEGNACDMTQLKLSNPNKDSMSLYGPVTIQRDIPNTTVVNLLGYQQTRNGRYDRIMLLTRTNLNLCTMMSKNSDTINDMGNIPSSCPIQTGTYNFNYIADTSRLPNSLPFDKLKLTMEALVKPGSDVLCKYAAYINVVKNQTNQQPRRKG